jgi:hypothetical protein
VEINKSSNFAHITRLPSEHIHDIEKEYSRSLTCNVLHTHHVFIPGYLYFDWFSILMGSIFLIGATISMGSTF